MMSSLGRRLPPVSGAAAVAAAALFADILGERRSTAQAADVPDNNLSSTTSDDGEPRDVNNSREERSLPSLAAILPLTSSCACEGRDGSFGLRRHQTMKMFSDTSTVATLRSRYDVDWDAPIGEGAFGSVYLCRDLQSGREYAMKKIPKRLTNKESFTREIDALLYIRESGGHPGICRLIENFDEGGSYFLVLDLIQGGELFDQLARSGPYSEADAARLVREVASALAYLHGVGIVHADLKPEVSTLFDTYSNITSFPSSFTISSHINLLLAANPEHYAQHTQKVGCGHQAGGHGLCRNY